MNGFCWHLRRTSTAAVLSVLLSLLFGFGCATGGMKGGRPVDKADIDSLLVIPFVNRNAMHGENEIYRCGLCGGMFETGPVEAGADTLITEKIGRLLSAECHVRLVPNDSVEEVRAMLLRDPGETLTDLELMSKIGNALGAEAVLTGSVYRWVERAGSNYAADAPASVGFEIDLIDTKTGRLIWRTRFEETQQFLIDNLLKIGTFLKRGGRWVTAEEMAATGLKDVLERSPIP